MRPSPDSDLEAKGDAPPFGRSIARMMGALWRPEMRRWRFRIFAAVALTIVAKGLSVLAPVFMGAGINALTPGGDDGSSGITAALPALAAASFVTLFALFAAARFLSNALPAARDAFFSSVAQDAQRLVAVDAFRHAQHLDLQFHLTRRSGALNRVIERGSGAMDYLLRFLAFNIGPTIVELALAAIVLATLYGWRLSVAAVATVAAYAAFTIVVTEWRNKQRRAFNAADTALRGVAMDTLTNFETVKAFAAEERESGRFNDALQEYNRHFVTIMRSLGVLNGGQELIMTGGLLAAALIAGFAAQSGAMQAGDVTAVILMLINIYRPLNILGWAWREIKQGTVDIEKLFELMDTAPAIADAPDARAFAPKGGAVRFEDVRFAHQGRAQGLEGVDLDIPAGAFVGLVGPSGAGKSTILKLLFRFYDPKTGRVFIDGQDLRALKQTSLRAALGLVPQDVVLFNDTLRFNIAYAQPDLDDEAIMEAARRAQLGAFIESLPDGLDTRVGERGLKLSGGEKQRVGVARAILRDPAILVLDEATSSLDSATEREVQTALREAARGRTTIAVAHRLSTIVGADRIFVIDDGRVVEAGSHDDLLRADGAYAALWRRQTEESDPSLVAAQ